MRSEINVSVDREIIAQATDLVYAQKPYWCGATWYPLKMSLLRPRAYFDYDRPRRPLPTILFITGGGWTETDNNVWLPELVYFAKRGYLVACVSYALSPTWIFPEPLIDLKAAVRYLRAHADDLGADARRIAVMGESAGGYYAAMMGVTGGLAEFEKGDNLDQSSRVQAAVPWYPPVDLADFEGRGDLSSYDQREQYLKRGEFEPQSLLAGVEHLRKHPAQARRMDPRAYITPDAPPFMLLHGTRDSQVPLYHSEALYKALQDAGVPAELLVIRGAEHADHHFVQPEIQERILRFLNERMGVRA